MGLLKLNIFLVLLYLNFSEYMLNVVHNMTFWEHFDPLPNDAANLPGAEVLFDTRRHKLLLY